LKPRIEVEELTTLAISSTDATTRNRESKWEKLATDTLMGNKKGGLPIIEAEVVLEVTLVEFISVGETHSLFRSAHSIHALEEFKSCKSKQIVFFITWRELTKITATTIF
jgi:flavin reductase (DIM6/NTAB) family NADH-FMN oxidoreductase RutF